MQIIKLINFYYIQQNIFYFLAIFRSSLKQLFLTLLLLYNSIISSLQLYYSQNMETKQQLIQQINDKITILVKILMVGGKSVPAIIYFLWIGYRLSFLFEQKVETEIILYALFITLFALNKCNFLYAFAPFLYFQSRIFSILFLMINLLACNQKWKIFLFSFTLFIQIPIDEQTNTIIMTISSLSLCYFIYSSLIFKSIKQNIHYFIGFFILSGFSIIKILAIYLQKEIEAIIIYLGFVPIVGFVGYAIINQKIKKIGRIEIQAIKNSSVMSHYLEIVEKQLQDNVVYQAKIYTHIKNCQNLNCFCKSKCISKNASAPYIRYLYERAIQILQHRIGNQFIQKYISYLIKNGQTVHPLCFLQKWKPNNYFQLVSKVKCVREIQKVLMDSTGKIRFFKEYSYALQYDSFCQQLRITINLILQLKIKFWQQVNYQYPRLQNLQRFGHQINKLMSKINVFYSLHIKVYQLKLFCLEGAFIYATYLSLTTNFTQYTEHVVKDIQKKFDQSYHTINKKAFETYVVRVVVRNNNNSHLARQIKLKENAKQVDIKQIQFSNKKQMLIIDRISRQLCQIYGKTKKELIGCEIKELIPNQYKEVHDRRLFSLLNFQNKIKQKIRSSQILHSQLMLPMKGSNNELFIAQICIKIQADIKDGLSFISIVRLSKQKSKTAILDFNGQINQKQAGFNQDILDHAQVNKYIQKLRQQWKSLQTMHEETFILTINSCIYQVKISSPLLFFFLGKQNLDNINPPIHVEVINTSNQSDFLPRDKSKLQAIKNLQAKKHKQTSESNSQENRKEANTKLVSILQKYCQKQNVTIYRKILISFLIIIVFCIVAVFACFFSYDLEWDNTKQNNNPILDTLRMLKISTLTVEAALDISDQAILNKDVANTLNRTKINQYFQANSYGQFLYDQLVTFQQSYKDIFYQLHSNSSTILKDQLYQTWQHQIQYKNYTHGSANPMFKNMQMTYQQIILNYIIDINILQHNPFQKQILLSKTYDQQIIDIQAVTQLVTSIDHSIDNSINVTFIITICMSIIICLLLVPYICMLRKRYVYHSNIFDLIASLNSAIVYKEILSLKKYKLQFKHYYSQNSQFQKNNLEFEKLASQHDIFKQLTESLGVNVRISNKEQSFVSTNLIDNIQVNPFDKKNKLLKLRKRAGELYVKGSEFDASNFFKYKHLITYSMVLAFIVFLIVGIIRDRTYMNQIKNKKDHIFRTQTKILQSQIIFLLAKDFMRNGFIMSYNIIPIWSLSVFKQLPKDKSINFASLFLKSSIENVPIYDYNQKTNFEQIMQNCYSAYSDLDPSTLNKFCQYDYSYLIFQGQFGSLYKILQEQRYNNDMSFGLYMANNEVYKYLQIQKQLTQKSFYMQSINNQISNKLEAMVDILVENIRMYSTAYSIQQMNLFACAIVWAIVTFIVGTSLIISMKKQYLGEVYMLSFLNREMISNNKRIQSFIQTISKSMGGA